MCKYVLRYTVQLSSFNHGYPGGGFCLIFLKIGVSVRWLMGSGQSPQVF